MPLAFESLSHGTVAFGFFNIRTDLLLLENLFFFADDFCALVEDLAQEEAPGGMMLPGWTIPDRRDLGDLHGAIAGVNLSGFIGAVYRLYPFPQNRAEFKQNPEGFRNRAQAKELLQEWAREISIKVEVANEGQEIALGDYRFSASGWRRLVEYVWLGGMPRWLDGIRPDYVERMGRTLARSGSGIMAGPDLTRS